MNCTWELSLDPKLTLDGLLAFVGGLLAFFAIWRQTSRADTGLQKQLEAEKTARTEAEVNMRRAVARALVCEIADFDRLYIQKSKTFIDMVDISNCAAKDLPAAKAPQSNPFPIYTSNCSIIGSFDEETIRAIIGFYSEANSYLRTVAEYRDLYLQLVINQFNHPPIAVAARAYLQQMKAAMPELVRLGELVRGRISESFGAKVEASASGGL